jgi:hypothetical protein
MGSHRWFAAESRCSPRFAGPELMANIRTMLASGREVTRRAALEIQKRLGLA